jgi:hypothetical protein
MESYVKTYRLNLEFFSYLEVLRAVITSTLPSSRNQVILYGVGAITSP